MGRPASAWAAVVATLLLVGAVTASSAAPSAGVEIGPPEKKRIVFGHRLPNLGSQAPIFVGIDKGYYREEGFDEIKVVTTEQVREGVTGGSLDYGVAELGNTVEAIQQNAPLVIISGWRNREPYYIAARREIASVRDLDGKPVLLGGTPGDPNVNLRLGFLREAGWDLSTVRPSYVVVPGGSDAWVRLFLEGRLVMTYFFARHRPSIEAAGHRVVVFKMMEWPNDLMITNEGFLARHPNTTVRFLRATLRAMQIWMDPANKEYVISLMQRNGFTVTPAGRQMYEEGDLGLYDKDLALLPDGVARLLKHAGFQEPPKFERIANLFYVRKAWKVLGIKPRP